MSKTRIAAVGDSLTKGVILTENNRYSILDGSYLDIISNELDLYIENYGKFGSTVRFASEVIGRHEEEIASSEYTFLEFGGNDCDFDWMGIAQSPSEEHSPRTVMDLFKEQFIAAIERIRKLGSRPVIISLPPILPYTYFSFFTRTMSQEQKSAVVKWLGGDVGIISRWHETYNRELFKIAGETQTQIIDITSPFDVYKGDLGDLFCADGIHPNHAGHKLIAESIVNAYF